MSGANRTGAENLARIRAFYATHLGCSIKECARALGLRRQNVGRHLAKIRAEWRPQLAAQLQGAHPAPRPAVMSNGELLRRTRENAAEMAVRTVLERQFGNYAIDGARGVIRAAGPVAVNYRELAAAAVARADQFEGRPLRGAA